MLHDRTGAKPAKRLARECTSMRTTAAVHARRGRLVRTLVLADFLCAGPTRAVMPSMLAHVRPILAGGGSEPGPPPVPTPRVVVATPPPREPAATLRLAPEGLALDRRGGPRHGDRPPLVDRFTAATHRPLPLVLGLGVHGRWALVKGLSIGPAGVLVHLLDTTDPELDPRDRVASSVWMRLARCADPQRVPSPLWLSSCCVQAPALVAELSRRAALRGHVETPQVVLVPLGWHGSAPARPDPAMPQLVGTLAPLADPRPQVLGIALADAELATLRTLLTPPFAIAAPRAAGLAEPAPRGAPTKPKPRRRRTKAPAP